MALIGRKAGIVETWLSDASWEYNKDRDWGSRERGMLRELLCLAVWPREFGCIWRCPCGCFFLKFFLSVPKTMYLSFYCAIWFGEAIRVELVEPKFELALTNDKMI